MTIDRRRILWLAASVSLLPVSVRSALAQAYPSRPVKLVSPYAAGGATDIIARLIGQWLTERTGAAFVIENRPGAGANIGTEAVVRAAPDGYTLLLASSANAVNATLYQNLKFSFLQDIVPIASIGGVPNTLLVNPSVSAKTTADFIAQAKANPGKITVGLPGIGSPQHLAAELFKLMAGIDLQFVHYRGGGPVMNDLIAGHVQCAFASSVASVEHVRAGTVRGLGVTSANRSDAVPEVPTLDEAVPGYESTNFYGIAAPRGTPDDIISKLNSEINAGLDNVDVRSRLATLGIVSRAMSSAEFGNFVAAETEKWGKVIKTAGLKAE